jgi:hypothetical protein
MNGLRRPALRLAAKTAPSLGCGNIPVGRCRRDDELQLLEPDEIVLGDGDRLFLEISSSDGDLIHVRLDSDELASPAPGASARGSGTRLHW